jgi:hypothetical protein
MKKLIEKDSSVLVLLTLALIALSFIIGRQNAIYILLGFVIPWAMLFDEMREKSERRRYRFSFVRFIYSLDLYLKTKVPEKFFPMALSAFLFCLFLYLLTGNGIPAFSYVGSLVLVRVMRMRGTLLGVSQKANLEIQEVNVNEEIKSELPPPSDNHQKDSDS